MTRIGIGKEGVSVLAIGSIVWGVKNLNREAVFWQEALGYELTYRSDDFAILKPKGKEGMQLSLKVVTSDHARRHHMDLFADNREAEVDRLLKLGAHRKEWQYEENADYTVLEDPDGNPFCIVQK